MEKKKKNRSATHRTREANQDYVVNQEVPVRKKSQSEEDIMAFLSGAYQNTNPRKPVARPRPHRSEAMEMGENGEGVRKKPKPHTVRKNGKASARPKPKTTAPAGRKNEKVEEARSIEIPFIKKEKKIEDLKLEIPVEEIKTTAVTSEPVMPVVEEALENAMPEVEETEVVTELKEEEIPVENDASEYKRKRRFAGNMPEETPEVKEENIPVDIPEEITEEKQEDVDVQDEVPEVLSEANADSKWLEALDEGIEEDSVDADNVYWDEVWKEPEEEKAPEEKKPEIPEVMGILNNLDEKPGPKFDIPASKAAEKKEKQEAVKAKPQKKKEKVEVTDEATDQENLQKEPKPKKKEKSGKGSWKILLLVALILIAGFVFSKMGRSDKDKKAAEATTAEKVAETKETKSELQKQRAEIMDQAQYMAMGYDYDGAMDLLKTVDGWESDQEIQACISDYTQKKSECVAIDVTKVPHIFYHSLVNKPEYAFDVDIRTQLGVDHFNAWMTTVGEFDKITQEMYDRGYVFVRLRDLVVETKDEDGNVHYEPNTNLLLPPDKKPVVLSVDDLSYYHTYETASYPDKLVVDENGDVKCHYILPDGTEQVGDFDVVPRLNTFLTEHPDGAYKGARGLIALTGYNGVLGYRTDGDYLLKEHLQEDQQQWLDKHPEFDFEKEVAEATKVADAVKASGWEFASHTWGHINVTERSLEDQMTDNGKWEKYVVPVVGKTDTLIFAFGNDIGEDIRPYTMDNEKFAYYKSRGYNFYCNIDSSIPYYVEIKDNYVRQSRINFDGYRMYEETQGNSNILEPFFDANEVFDGENRPTPVNPMG